MKKPNCKNHKDCGGQVHETKFVKYYYCENCLNTSNFDGTGKIIKKKGK